VTFVLDTNSLIYFFKGMGRIAERILATPPASLAIPSVALYELEVGIAKSSSPAPRRHQLNQLLALVPVLPFAAPEAAIAAQIRADLERAGTPIGVLDTLIAGITLRHAGVLVTHNVDEFRRIDRLAVEDWY
jgi:tRNA(fMet)-specific endonuclease VapC